MLLVPYPIETRFETRGKWRMRFSLAEISQRLGAEVRHLAVVDVPKVNGLTLKTSATPILIVPLDENDFAVTLHYEEGVMRSMLASGNPSNPYGFFGGILVPENSKGCIQCGTKDQQSKVLIFSTINDPPKLSEIDALAESSEKRREEFANDRAMTHMIDSLSKLQTVKRQFDLEELEEELDDKITWVFVDAFDPGHTEGNHFHKHKSEVYVRLTGKFRMTVNSVDGFIPTGMEPGNNYDGAVFEPRIAHLVKNITDEVSRLLIISTGNPATVDENYFEVIPPRS